MPRSTKGHTERANKGVRHHLREWNFEQFLFGADILITSFFPELRSSSLEDNRGEGLWNCSLEDSHETSKDQVDLQFVV